MKVVYLFFVEVEGTTRVDEWLQISRLKLLFSFTTKLVAIRAYIGANDARLPFYKSIKWPNNMAHVFEMQIILMLTTRQTLSAEINHMNSVSIVMITKRMYFRMIFKAQTFRRYLLVNFFTLVINARRHQNKKCCHIS